MTKGIRNRVKIQDCINALNQLDFEEVTEENLQKLLPNARIDFVNKIEEDITDISIDDYIFTIHKKKIGEKYPTKWVLIGATTNKPYFLSDYVEVYLPMQEDDNCIYGCEMQIEGYIELHNSGKEFWLRLHFYNN